ncbi:tetratricopeptide repeat protein [Sphingopyxis sp. MSC1_008]|jgi:hypothetical protein|uniref:tetratricopeptide repeat protein n=1 Tax=Sphingopyxis sp. MSC1_008 TaxID=2909265 RepID=UPI0020C0C0EA|nr:hypothetical protein [Sphingopyxis sp. MSC1_008]
MARKHRRSLVSRGDIAPFLKSYAFVGIGALVCGALTFSQALAGLDATGRNPMVASPFRNPVAPLNMIRVGASEDKKRIEVSNPKRAARIARESLERSPVNPNALHMLALVAETRGEGKKSAQYVALAEKLSRRHAGSQMLLAGQAMQAKHYAVAIEHIDRALRTEPEITPQVFPILADALRFPDFRKYLSIALRRKAPWRDSFFAYAAAQPYAQSGTAQLMLGLSGLKDSTDMRVAVALLAQGLTASRETDLLKRLYMHVPPTSIGLRNRPTEATFRDLTLLDGVPPVAWGVNEDTTNGALVAAGKMPGTVNINGWAEAGYGSVVAKKLLWLPTGRWNLLYSGRGNVGGAGARSNWEVRCVRPLADTSLTSSVNIFTAGSGTKSLGFTVPANCPVVLVELSVRGSLSGGASQIDLTDVRLVRGATN